MMYKGRRLLRLDGENTLQRTSSWFVVYVRRFGFVLPLGKQ